MEYHSKLFLFLYEELNNISVVKSIMYKLASLCRVYLCDYKNEEIGEFYDDITSVTPLKVYTKEDLNIAIYNRKNKGVHSLYCRLEIINSLPKYFNFVMEGTIDVGNGYCLCIVNPKDNVYEESDEIDARIAYALGILNEYLNNIITVDKNSIQTIRNGLRIWNEQGLINDDYKINYDYIDEINKRAEFLTAIKVSLKTFISCRIPPKPFFEFIGYLLGSPLSKKYNSWVSSWNKVQNK